VNFTVVVFLSRHGKNRLHCFKGDWADRWQHSNTRLTFIVLNHNYCISRVVHQVFACPTLFLQISKRFDISKRRTTSIVVDVELSEREGAMFAGSLDRPVLVGDYKRKAVSVAKLPPKPPRLRFDDREDDDRAALRLSPPEGSKPNGRC